MSKCERCQGDKLVWQKTPDGAQHYWRCPACHGTREAPAPSAPGSDVEAGPTPYTMNECDIIRGVETLMRDAHETAKAKGFYDEGHVKQPLASLMLMVSELAEAAEAIRHKDLLMSDKITAFTNLEEELADCIIRIADFAQFGELKLGEAIVAKMVYNKGRETRHGKIC